ncbi:MAG: GNAT family N-acetyltransferase [Bacteroidota bacterium]
MDSTTPHLTTDRLQLKSLQESDSSFILELLNTQGWLTFIGDRNVGTTEEAVSYIQNILNDETITYWVVYAEKVQIGVITLIKREHLPFYDIGFAFLPNYQGNGYAYEASNAILELVIETSDYQTILAVTDPSNHSSIHLIEKLGLSFQKIEKSDGETSNIYGIDLDQLKIDRLIKKFFSAFTNKNTSPNLDLIYETCLAEAIIIKNTKGMPEVSNLESFIAPRKDLLTNGSLQNFEEYEVKEKTIITRNIAQRFSTYQKEGTLDGKDFSEKGNKMFQFVKVDTTWKICNMIWDDE